MFFDLLILVVFCVLAKFSYMRSLAVIICCNFLAQVLVDIIFIDMGLYNYINNEWFFIIKAYILFCTISMMYINKGHTWIIGVLLINMVYMYGLWFEAVTNKGLFYENFTWCMTCILVLEIVYLFGISNFYGLFKRSLGHIYRSIFDRSFYLALSVYAC